MFFSFRKKKGGGGYLIVFLILQIPKKFVLN